MRAFILRRVGLIQEGGAGSVLVGRAGRAGPRAAAGLSRPQRLPLHRAGRRGGRGRSRRGRAPGRAARGAAADDLPERHGAEAADRRRGRRVPRHHARARSADSSTTWPWSAPARPASPPRSTPRPRACRCWCSTSARSAARPERRRGSRIIWASPPASPAMALAGRAFSQALKFGAEIAIPLEVARLDCGGAGAASRRSFAPGAHRRPRRAGAHRGRRLRRALSPARHPRTLRPSRAPASPTGRRRSRRSCARARRWRWSAAATRRARPSCSWRPRSSACTWSCAAPGSRRRCRAT